MFVIWVYYVDTMGMLVTQGTGNIPRVVKPVLFAASLLALSLNQLMSMKHTLHIGFMSAISRYFVFS